MNRFLASLLLLTAGLLPAIPSHAQDHYQAVFNDSLDTVAVSACFAGRPPQRLSVNPAVAGRIHSVRHGQRDLNYRLRGGRLNLPSLPEDACVDYRIDLQRPGRLGRGQALSRVGEDLLLAGNLWLWRGSRERTLDVRVTLPAGYHLSTPWPVAGGEHHYRPDPTPGSWSSLTAIGRFAPQPIELPGGTIRLAVVGTRQTEQVAKMREWIAESAEAVASTFGRFPQSQPQVLVIHAGRQSEPVPWAQVVRGGGVAAHFYVDAQRSLSAFRDDWVATHELAHMLLPYVSSRDRWVSEGLASYYQNVLRARDGRLSERSAWSKLHAGFQRGLRDDRDAPLRDVSRNMRSNRAYMRVYWSGAAVMLMADTRLRALSDGQLSLDEALRRLNTCCMANDRVWRGRELFARLDELTGTRVFSELYQENAGSDDFPPVFESYDELGLIQQSRRLRLSDQAELAAVRRAIMNG